MRLTSWLNPARRRSPRPARGAGGARPHLERLEERTVPSIVSENQLAGTPSTVWDTDHADDYTVRGYVSGFSLNRGQAATFKVEMLDPVTGTEVGPIPFHIQIFRMGYYQGNGARQVAFANGLVNQAQPLATYDLTTGLVDGGNWHASYTWAIPAAATSGVYFAKVTRDDGVLGTDGRAASNHVFFVVRDDGGHSDVLVKTSDATWQAYNAYGGASLYVVDRTIFPAPELPNNRAYQVSYNRPFTTARAALPVTNQNAIYSWNWVFYSEYPAIRWLEANGYDVSYFSDIDAQRSPALMKNHKIFAAIGHDEYWSQAERDGVEAAGAAGVNLAFLDGNEIFERTAWEPGIGGTAADPRTLDCYKDSFNPTPIPHPGGWQGFWREQAPGVPSTRPENAVTGEWYVVSDTHPTNILVPEADAKDRFWRNTSIANLQPGQHATLQGLLGFEWDESPDNGHQPAGLLDLSSTLFNGPSSGPLHPLPITHSLTLHRDSSGALVFGAGTILWSWALDNTHDPYQDGPEPFNPPFGPIPNSELNYIPPVDPRVRQAMVNLFADMGNVQPGSLQPGLVRATPSTDHTPPTSTVAAPAAGTVVNPGQTVTIRGTAADAGGGVVAGVEVSVNGGLTWHPATGHASWSYTWVPTRTGTTTIRSRAVDDSGNLEAPSAGVPVNVLDGSTVALTSSANPSVYGQAVALQAIVTSSSAPVTSGSVSFMDGTTVLAVVPLGSTGQAAFTTHSLPAGTHHLVAAYSGTAVYASGAARLSQVVNRAPLTIRADDKARVAGQPPTALTATYLGLVNGDTSGVVRGLQLASPGASSNRVGVYPITASGESSSNYTITFVSGTLTVTPGALNTFRLTPSTLNPVAGQSFELTVTALDAYGNVVTGYRGSPALSSDDPLAANLGQHAFTAADNGAFTFQVTLRTRKLVHLTLTDPASHITSQVDVSVT